MIMKKIRRILIVPILAGVSMFTSCIIYHPQAVDVPLIHEKNQLQIDGALSINTLPPIFSTSLGLTASYGVTDWMAVQIHGGTDGNKCYYTQAAVGAYKPINKFVLEGFIGFGYGESYKSSENNDGAITKEVKGNYKIPYFQADFGWAKLANGNIDLGIGIKNGLFIPEFTGRNYNSDGSLHSIDKLDTKSYLLEPQIFFRGGSELLKATLRIGHCTFFGKRSPGDESYNPLKGINASYAPLSISFGLTFNIPLNKK